MKNKKAKYIFFLGVCAISILSFTQKTKAATDTEANVNTELNLPYRIPDKAAYEDVEDLDLSETQYDVNPETSSKDIHFFGQDFTGENAAKYMMIPDFKFGNVQYKGKEVTVPVQKLKYTLNNGKEYEGLYMEYAMYNYNQENRDDFNFYVSIAPFKNTNNKELKGSKLDIIKNLYLLNPDYGGKGFYPCVNDLIGNQYPNDIETNSESIQWLNKDALQTLMSNSDDNMTRLVGSDIEKMNLIIPENTTIEDGTKYTSTLTWTTEADPLPSTEIQYDGYWGTAPYTFDEETGELVVYPGELADCNTSNGENGTGGYIGTQLNVNDIKSVKFVGHVVAPKNSEILFGSWDNLESFDGTNLDTSNVTDMMSMFIDCNSLTNIDVSNWDTSNATTMGYMFYSCSSLKSLDVSNFDTSKVTDMGGMFDSCSSLTNIDVSNWDTANVTKMYNMFTSCTSLTSIDVSNWDTSNATTMGYMFYSCSSLTSIDVSNWDTSKVISMVDMFYNCSSLTSLDVSNWDTANVVYMDYMFKNTTKLDKLKLGETFKFKRDTSLSGTWKLENGDKTFTGVQWYDYNGATDAGIYIKQ